MVPAVRLSIVIGTVSPGIIIVREGEAARS